MTFPAAAAAFATDKGTKAARGAARSADRARLPTGNRQYQGAILAEFVIAVLVVSTGPIVNPPQDGKDSPSPYRVGHLKQLLAVGAVYFVLALLSSGRHGRVAAWFGGLVLLGVGFTQVANGDLSALFKIFGPPQYDQVNPANVAAAEATIQPVGYQGTAPGPYGPGS